MKKTKNKKEQKNNEQEIQKMYFQLQQINNQITQLDKEIKEIKKKKQDFSKLSEEMNNMKNSESNSNSFSMVGAGIFAKTKLKDTDEFLINVGANTFVKKKRKDIIKILKEQVSEFDKVIAQIEQNSKMLNLQGQIIQGQMQETISKK